MLHLSGRGGRQRLPHHLLVVHSAVLVCRRSSASSKPSLTAPISAVPAEPAPTATRTVSWRGAGCLAATRLRAAPAAAQNTANAGPRKSTARDTLCIGALLLGAGTKASTKAASWS